MAAARQKEMKVSITVVATKTLTAGRLELSRKVDIKNQARTGGLRKPNEDSTARGRGTLRAPPSPAVTSRCTRRPRRRGPHQARFWLDGVEMPSSGRPGASQTGVPFETGCIPKFASSHNPCRCSVQGDGAGDNSGSRAALGWADGAAMQRT